jgi:hypothetical protein
LISSGRGAGPTTPNGVDGPTKSAPSVKRVRGGHCSEFADSDCQLADSGSKARLNDLFALASIFHDMFIESRSADPVENADLLLLSTSNVGNGELEEVQ